MGVGDDATRAQNAAANPQASTWLTANAGSGKTRVLTDRVARLLLGGAAPERILCLTYTKAAATEMQNRLLARLGEWAMLPQPELRARLAAIGAEEGADLAEARRLFARAIETPGGLKVQTIHAFCASILRRFPLEAGVPHGFTELDERSAVMLRADVLDAMIQDGMPEIADLTSLHSGFEVDAWLASISASDAMMGPPDAQALRRFAGLGAEDGEASLIADVIRPRDAGLIAAVIALAATGSVTDQRLGKRLKQGCWAQPGMDDIITLEGAMLYGAGARNPFGAKLGKLLTKATQAQLDDPEALDALMERVQDNRPRRLAMEFTRNALALHRFGYQFTRRYQAAKAAHGWLDFDDLITRTERLLSRPDMAPWVLFRLDGGIDHILVDEAQDTSPAQWRVIQHLTDEFMAGKGQKDRRTLFVVGDPKQSIYSFQGADIAVFEDRHKAFSRGFAEVGDPMQDAALLHSFRSSPAVLKLADAVFQGDMAHGLGGQPSHIPFHQTMPGRVDLWPVVEAPEKPDPGEWDDPVDQIRPTDAPAQLADAVADAIDAMLGTPIQARVGGLRPIRAGDVLILVQRRSALFHQIIAALKRRNLPVAGADRLKLGGEIAVRDIRALLAFLATPEDDLSLAEVLRSPFFGVPEDALYRLAAGRGTRDYLWQHVRAEAPDYVRETLSDMLAMSGTLRPYELISRILLRHGGRERLIARLGPEADDGIDELLTQALAYERTEPPSLTGFLVWLEGDEIEVRRQPGAADKGKGLIRVMTVHGSKGLEAPIVVIPDGAKRRSPPGDAILRRSDGPALPRGRKGERPDALETLVQAQADAAEEERRRLLYVALTRAESWLIVAAAGQVGDDAADSWHGMVAAGLEHMADACQPLPTPVGEGVRLSFGDWPSRLAGDDAPATITTGQAVAPDWLRTPAPAMSAPLRPVAASALGGAMVVDAQAGGTRVRVSAEDAALFGTRLHLILEHWTDLDGPDAARDLLAGAEGGLPDDAELDDLWADAVAVTQAEGLTHLFAPDADDLVLTEVALTAPVADLPILHGTVDRLLIGPDRVLAIDYKSNVLVPDQADDVPVGILRQMAAYRAALQAIWPDRRIKVAILWTVARSLMPIPDAVLDSERARPRRPDAPSLDPDVRRA